MEPVSVWRLPAKRGPSTPLVVMLHGRGADENDLIDLATMLPRAFAYTSVRGPIAMPEGGFCWFESRGVARPVTKSLRSALDGVRAWLDGPACSGYAPGRTYLLGFSQGMMLAGALVLDDPARFAGGVLLSGAIALDASPATAGRLAGVPLFLAHGTADAIIRPTSSSIRSVTCANVAVPILASTLTRWGTASRAAKSTISRRGSKRGLNV